jgi:ATP-dependent Clp protease ATP-binding subunit ClpB
LLEEEKMRTDKFTVKSQEAIQKAQQLAEKNGNQQVDAEHLLAGGYACGTGLYHPEPEKRF